MAKFITGNELNTEVEKIVDHANETLIIISPYIKLHPRYRSTLLSKQGNYDLHIIVVFGKNENDASKSISLDDIDFLKGFPNIEIRYEKRLHAKYYANESSAILTSMNLYSYSQDNNIEAGVLTKRTLLTSLANNFLSNVTEEESFDKQTQKYFDLVIKQSEIVYKKTTPYEKSLFKKTVKDPIIEDKTSHFFNPKQSLSNNYTIPTSDLLPHTGYCIRTRAEIPFNIKQPLCADGFREWNKYKNGDFKERYCHYSGESSNNETSFNSPILKKYWKEAKAKHNF